MTDAPCPDPVPVGTDETADGALGGTVRLIQPRNGYRFSLDAVLLARFAALFPAERAVDLGCGCGVVGLALLALGGVRRVVGLDLQPDMADRARRAARWNGWGDRCSFVVGDVAAVSSLFRAGSEPLVVSNPPYRPLGAGRVSPRRAVAVARHEIACTVDDVASAAAHLLRPGGALCVVYPAPRLARLTDACRSRGLEPKTLRLVHPQADRPASLALLRCVKGAGEGLEVTAPLVLHGEGRRYSDEAERLLGPP